MRRVITAHGPAIAGETLADMFVPDIENPDYSSFADTEAGSVTVKVKKA